MAEHRDVKRGRCAACVKFAGVKIGTRIIRAREKVTGNKEA